MNKKIAVALSGGVDSSVSALLLKQKGYDVVGIHAVCFDENLPFCTSNADREDAIKAAAALDIPVKIVDLTKEYRERVFNYFIAEYRNNHTPNPDILCNRDIKFDLILNHSVKYLGCDYFATGHYAKLDKNQSLTIPKDVSKDQTYFLAMVKKDSFKKVIFPLQDLTKSEVRQIAKKHKLFNANKPDSQGVCFIGEFKLTEFLKDKIKFDKGLVKNLKGEIIGKHFGLQKYTIGQRHGFEVDKYVGHPLYVIKKDVKKNILYVDKKEFASSDEFVISDVNLFNDLDKSWVYDVRIRHLGEFYRGKVNKSRGKNIKLVLSKKAYAVSPGQYAVLYHNNKVVAAGVISTKG